MSAKFVRIMYIKSALRHGPYMSAKFVRIMYTRVIQNTYVYARDRTTVSPEATPLYVCPYMSAMLVANIYTNTWFNTIHMYACDMLDFNIGVH